MNQRSNITGTVFTPQKIYLPGIGAAINRPQTRKAVEDLIETLIAYLDEFDGDCDLEPDDEGEEGADLEPTNYGWTNPMGETPVGYDLLNGTVRRED